MQLPLYPLIRFYFRSTGTRNLKSPTIDGYRATADSEGWFCDKLPQKCVGGAPSSSPHWYSTVLLVLVNDKSYQCRSLWINCYKFILPVNAESKAFLSTDNVMGIKRPFTHYTFMWSLVDNNYVLVKLAAYAIDVGMLTNSYWGGSSLLIRGNRIGHVLTMSLHSTCQKTSTSLSVPVTNIPRKLLMLNTTIQLMGNWYGRQEVHVLLRSI